MNEINYLVIFETLNIPLYFVSNKILYYKNNNKKYLVYKDEYGNLVCYSVLLTKKINQEELIILEDESQLQRTHIENLKTTLKERLPNEKQIKLVNELIPIKDKKALNYIIQLRKLSKQQNKDYESSFLLEQLFKHDDNFVKLKLSSIEDFYNKEEKLMFYDYLILNTKKSFQLFNKSGSIFYINQEESENLQLFFSGELLLSYSLHNKLTDTILLSLDPELILPLLLKQSISYNRIVIGYSSQLKSSLIQVLKFICEYIKFKTNDIIEVFTKDDAYVYLKLYLRDTELLPGSISLKITKSAQIQQLKNQYKIINTPDNNFYNSLKKLSTVKEDIFNVDLQKNKEDITNYNYTLRYLNTNLVLTQLIELLTEYYVEFNIFEFNNIKL